MFAVYHVCIKAMKGLSVSHHYIVGDVNYIVYGSQTNGSEFVLQPFGTFFYVTTGDADTCISLASLVIIDSDFYWQVFVIYNKITAIGSVKRCLIAVLKQPSI